MRLDRHGFADAVAWVARSLPTRPTDSALACMRIRSDGAAVTVEAFNGEVSGVAQLSAEIATPGTVLVSGRLLYDITRLLPAKPIELESDGCRMVLTCGSARYSLPVIAAESYPDLPAPPADSGAVACEVFSEAVRQVAIAAGRDEALPMLSGIRVEITGSTLVLVATDRFRLAVRELTWTPANANGEAAVLVPAKALAEVAKSLPAGADLQLALGQGSGLGRGQMLGLRIRDRHSTHRLLAAEFPKYRQLLPGQYSAMATVGVAELSEAIKRVALVASRTAQQIVLSFTGDGELRLSGAGGDDAGQAEEYLPVDFHGQALSICFNPHYLTDGLAALHSEKATLGFTSPVRPAVLSAAVEHPDTGAGPFDARPADYMYLLMPVRIPS